EEYKKHVKIVLQTLQDAKLLVKLAKNHFYIQKLVFRNIRNIRFFLGYINFYRQFIKNYSRIAHSLTNLIKKEQ
ncbi:hypothetical protein M406DRAFT_234560, partial [Cryphonectria parasitica EP155]